MPSNYTRSFAYDGPLMQSSYKTRMRKPVELLLVPMIDIFTVLVTFLLMTAVFSRITILQLDLPSENATSAGTPPAFRLEVIVRHEGFELTNGTQLIATIPKVDGEYDFKALTNMAVTLKREYPDAKDASVLLVRDVKYDYLIQSMDAIRAAEVTEPASAATVGAPAGAATRMELFTSIAVGEAP
ncbi:biopolymer transport protein ExbD [Povalibacter uvarum]|uniref:Biopolymer transport protein ExbD n=1 Tax=Povalibacter uvarum TaxID=732238 RepID=A0A841HJI3_9GAMM|nr:biopolymer transporter ExbD [Povalibacter uvarum]MBB6092378.1 biopolymer transport protein ExbD [Povalibacter uvarum]